MLCFGCRGTLRHSDNTFCMSYRNNALCDCICIGFALFLEPLKMSGSIISTTSPLFLLHLSLYSAWDFRGGRKIHITKLLSGKQPAAHQSPLSAFFFLVSLPTGRTPGWSLSSQCFTSSVLWM